MIRPGDLPGRARCGTAPARRPHRSRIGGDEDIPLHPGMRVWISDVWIPATYDLATGVFYAGRARRRSLREARDPTAPGRLSPAGLMFTSLPPVPRRGRMPS